MEAEIIKEKAFDQDFIDAKLSDIKTSEEYKSKDIFVLKIPKVLPPDNKVEDFAYGFVVKPIRLIMAKVFNLMRSDNVAEALDLVLRNGLLEKHSDPQILKDDELYFPAISQIEELILIRRGELKKN